MPCRQKKAAPKADPVDVRMSDPDQKRPPFGHKTTPLGYLRPDFPLPRPGGMIYLPRNATGDTRKQAFGFGGTRTPFRVVECSWVYAREKGEKLDPLDPRPALHVKTTMHVRRLTPQGPTSTAGGSASRGWNLQSSAHVTQTASWRSSSFAWSTPRSTKS